MATQKTVSAEEITEGTAIPVRGTLVFSRLAKVVEGDALAKSDQTRTNNGMRPIGVPHTSITLANAEVIVKDPANPTKEEAFVTERRYSSAKHPDRGQQYSIDNKSTVLPQVFQLDENNQAVQINPLEGELASGIDVIVVLRVYKPKSYENRGLSLDQVIITQTGPVPYYSGGGTAASADALQSAGITYAAAPVAQNSNAAATVTDEEGAQQAVPEGSINQGGFVLPGPGTEPAPAAYQAPAAPAAPAQQAPAPAPAQQPAQAAPAAPTAEDQVAQLRAQLAQAEAKAAGNNGESAFGAPADQGAQGPWTNDGAGISYPGR